MLALAEPLPDRVTRRLEPVPAAPRSAGDRPAHRRAPRSSLTIFQRGGSGRDAGRRRLRRARLHRHAGLRCARRTWRCSSSRPRTSCDYFEYLPDSAGAGEWRGGYGTPLELDASTARASAARRSATTSAAEGADPAQGLFGGEDRRAQRAAPDASRTAPCATGAPRRSSQHPAGDRLRRPINGGGGGYGDPRRRDPELVLAEVRDGLLSPRARRASLRRRASTPTGARATTATDDGRALRARRCGVSYRLGIDVGGTFTDFLCLGDDVPRSSTRRARRPTIPRVGFVTGLERDRRAARTSTLRGASSPRSS